ncbi:hypothetical protein NDU88_001317 [Pleurodeles waltl]|uniref:Uncharacterized protein n=1 Tax=Pleurodeles waltl TaxID=8319 RepID=A0AAV7VYU1_PLEWA|nr:hypothetical protein NDU88_001317 [Pleurodeles waltl]
MLVQGSSKPYQEGEPGIQCSPRLLPASQLPMPFDSSGRKVPSTTGSPRCMELAQEPIPAQVHVAVFLALLPSPLPLQTPPLLQQRGACSPVGHRFLLSFSSQVPDPTLRRSPQLVVSTGCHLSCIISRIFSSTGYPIKASLGSCDAPLSASRGNLNMSCGWVYGAWITARM